MAAAASTSKQGAIVDDSETVPAIPNLALAQAAWLLQQAHLTDRHVAAKHTLLEGIEQDEMAPYLQALRGQVDLGDTSSLHRKLEAKNEQELAQLDAKIEDARQNLGETDISDLLKARASYLARIGHKDLALEAYGTALEKVVGIGSRIDLRLAMIRVGFFHSDFAVITENVDKAKALVDSGGDWDRRNRLKAYEGLYRIAIRDFKLGAELLIDTMPTFGATELMSFEDIIALAILSGQLSLQRTDYKKKLAQIMEAPEVLSVIENLPHLKTFLTVLYNCEYQRVFPALGAVSKFSPHRAALKAMRTADVEQHHFLPNRLLAVHTRYYIREMRIKAYAQLLESYRSVTMASLAAAFGVNETFLDADLARFIAAGRLNFSIDRINGVVETNRPDARNARYEQVVKQGDALLSSVQRVARVLG